MRIRDGLWEITESIKDVGDAFRVAFDQKSRTMGDRTDSGTVADDGGDNDS